LISISTIVFGWIAPRRSYARDRELARWVGRRHSVIASDLLSAVELVHAPVRPGAPSAALVDALVETTETQLAKITPASLLPAVEVSRARAWMLGAVAANLALALIAPHFVAIGWQRLVAPPPAPFDGAELSAVPLVGDHVRTSSPTPRATPNPAARSGSRAAPGPTAPSSSRSPTPVSASRPSSSARSSTCSCRGSEAPIGARGASAPPASITSARPSRMAWNASPTATVPEAQLIALVTFGPDTPNSIAALQLVRALS